MRRAILIKLQYLPTGKVDDRKRKTSADSYTVEYTKTRWLLRIPRAWGADCYDSLQ